MFILFGFAGNFVSARLMNHGYLGKALGYMSVDR
jgi:hypothetical protein